jgi:hypothetical protein
LPVIYPNKTGGKLQIFISYPKNVSTFAHDLDAEKNVKTKDFPINRKILMYN